MICDVLGIVADVNDAWDGTNTGAKNLCPIKPQVCWCLDWLRFRSFLIAENEKNRSLGLDHDNITISSVVMEKASSWMAPCEICFVNSQVSSLLRQSGSLLSGGGNRQADFFRLVRVSRFVEETENLMSPASLKIHDLLYLIEKWGKYNYHFLGIWCYMVQLYISHL